MMRKRSALLCDYRKENLTSEKKPKRFNKKEEKRTDLTKKAPTLGRGRKRREAVRGLGN